MVVNIASIKKWKTLLKSKLKKLRFWYEKTFCSFSNVVYVLALIV